MRSVGWRCGSGGMWSFGTLRVFSGLRTAAFDRKTGLRGLFMKSTYRQRTRCAARKMFLKGHSTFVCIRSEGQRSGRHAAGGGGRGSVSCSAQPWALPQAQTVRDWRCSSWHQTDSCRSHHGPLRPRGSTAAPRPCRGRPLSSALPVRNGSCASSSLESHSCRRNSTCYRQHSDVRATTLRQDRGVKACALVL